MQKSSLSDANSKPKKSRARSFYMDGDLISDLESQSKRTGISINALVNKILKENTLHAYSTKEYCSMILPSALVAGMMNPENEKMFMDFAKKTGGPTFKDAVLTSGRPNSLDTFRYYLKDGYCGYCNWAEYYERIFSDKILIKLNHNVGHVWSKFMKEYFYGGLREMFGEESIPENALSVVETGLVILLPIHI